MPASATEEVMMARPNRDDRRKEPRLLCAELVTVYWLDEFGNPRRSAANLEDLSHCGACLLMDSPIAPDSEVRIDTGSGHYLGNVRYSAPFDAGYLLGIQFLPGCEWVASRFQPAHLFDPRSLLPPAGNHQASETVEEGTAEVRPAAPEPEQADLQRLLDILRSDFA
ncbi:MAG: PilZ domain-containing protein [Acidobacteria bacterium]|nr:PilZ domain-containing protein [Acidobacteriota bacterium]